jgi:hypothetical protein
LLARTSEIDPGQLKEHAMLRKIMIVLVAGVALANGPSAEASSHARGGARIGSGFGTARLGSSFDAQQALQQDLQQTVSLSQLISQGFDIKAAASTAGSAAQVFLQKDKDVFACTVFLPLDVPQRESRCIPVN